MKKLLAAWTAVALLLGWCAATAEGYRVAGANEASFGALLMDLVYLYEHPDAEAGGVVGADLEAIRSVSEGDYAVARAIAEHWSAVYLDPGYSLCLYGGGERATELEATGLADSATHAFVVLGYALENGEMTRELKGRCAAAAAAARSYPSAILVCSGGATGSNNPQGHTEAGLMRDYLVAQGIELSRICVDERAMTTVENAVNTLEILKTRGIETMTIVTSAYHQRWGQAIYNAMSAIYGQVYGYSPRIVGNYSFDIEPEHDSYRRDDRIAARQLASLLGLPKEVSEALAR